MEEDTEAKGNSGMHSIERCHEMMDTELVRLAQSGSDTAYNVLMQRHRGRMLRWSLEVTRERHMAEDVLQDSMMRAYMLLGALREPEKFLGWMKRIVRNRAYRIVRRGGPYAKELPFAAYGSRDASSNEEETVEWRIHTLLSASRAQCRDDNPLELLLRYENEQALYRLLRLLNRKERGMLEELVFYQRTPQEIASLYDTSSANVYTTLSRSRRKLQLLTYQSKLTQYLKERSSGGEKRRSKQLGIDSLYFGEIWDSFALCVLHAIQYKDSVRYTLPEIMGRTGLAFRLQVKRTSVDAKAVRGIHWPAVYRKALRRLGYQSASIGDGGKVSSVSDKLMEAYAFVQQSLDAGHPVIVWGIRVEYFALIHGYDDQRRRFHMTGLFEGTDIPYEELGPAGSSELFVLSLGRFAEVEPIEALKAALTDVIEHAEGDESSPNTEYAYGLAAYDVWMGLLDLGKADPHEHAHLVWSTASSRYFAYQYLLELKKECAAFGMCGRALAELAGEAAASYLEALAGFQRLKTLFPFPHGGRMDRSEIRKEGVLLLRGIRDAERSGVSRLKTMLQLLT
ncbi:sigma-70 family RNA polymerase sigma factor [Paenibacillus pinisoli]|uniref:Sigma-70 family RNA polymerase sigma factor n=2 Tax=Paenibacillus pinisoli TaxID=1276110 RepID=A0A3A6Q2H3_9BACL|nr:sigma-70 family RNA polymerase sigma factor [Paenibacillus pinisoli]